MGCALFLPPIFLSIGFLYCMFYMRILDSSIGEFGEQQRQGAAVLAIHPMVLERLYIGLALAEPYDTSGRSGKPMH